VIRIQQRGSDDCGIATLAMVLGVPYEDAFARVALALEKRRARGLGIDEFVLDCALGEAGFAYRRIYRYQQTTTETRPQWPPAPFAPRHWALVAVAAGGHAVAMDATGRVLDPYAPWRTSLTHTDYTDVYHVTGVWPVASPVPA
jgi:hypothetical protein